MKDIEDTLTGSPRTQWFQQREKLCQQAVKCIMGIEAELKLENFDVALGNNPDHRMEIGGVTVTVVPDLVVRGVNRKGPCIGAVKFRYVKTKPVTDEWAAYSAAVLHRFVEDYLAGEEIEAERRHCRYVDVFAGKIHEAPESFKDRRRDIEAACWQIKQLWGAIKPNG